MKQMTIKTIVALTVFAAVTIPAAYAEAEVTYCDVSSNKHSRMYTAGLSAGMSTGDPLVSDQEFALVGLGGLSRQAYPHLGGNHSQPRLQSCKPVGEIIDRSASRSIAASNFIAGGLPLEPPVSILLIVAGLTVCSHRKVPSRRKEDL